MARQTRHVRRSKKGKRFVAGRSLHRNRYKKGKRFGAFGNQGQEYNIADIIQYTAGNKAKVTSPLYLSGQKMPYATPGLEISRERAKDIEQRLYRGQLQTYKPLSKMEQATRGLEETLKRYKSCGRIKRKRW